MEKTVRASVHRWTIQRQRKAREDDPTDGTIEIWVNEGAPQYGIDVKSGDQAPPPKIPATPPGHIRKGWKEDTNKILASIQTAPVVGMPAEPTYDPSITGSSAGSNDGEGTPPKGYSWTTKVRRKILLEKVVYTMTYQFEKKAEEASS